jgi:hypothetical protein
METDIDLQTQKENLYAKFKKLVYDKKEEYTSFKVNEILKLLNETKLQNYINNGGTFWFIADLDGTLINGRSFEDEGDAEEKNVEDLIKSIDAIPFKNIVVVSNTDNINGIRLFKKAYIKAPSTIEKIKWFYAQSPHRLGCHQGYNFKELIKLYHMIDEEPIKCDLENIPKGNTIKSFIRDHDQCPAVYFDDSLFQVKDVMNKADIPCLRVNKILCEIFQK